MVNRILKAGDTIAANATDEVLDEFSPRAGQTYEILEIWFANVEGVSYALSVRERKLIDDLEAEDAPGVGERLVYGLDVEEGDNLQILASESGGADAEPRAYLLVDEE